MPDVCPNPDEEPNEITGECENTACSDDYTTYPELAFCDRCDITGLVCEQCIRHDIMVDTVCYEATPCTDTTACTDCY